MAKVKIQLPGVLASVVEGRDTISVDAHTVRAALDALLEKLPVLGVHLFDESGEFREHVLCFHNSTNTRWLKDLHVATETGDTITILQAVSGG